jgi:hypothetical protein
MSAEPYRLPVFRDPESGRKVPLRSGTYTVFVERPDGTYVKAVNWDELPQARRSARLLAAIDIYKSARIVRPAGVLDDDDFDERIVA